MVPSTGPIFSSFACSMDIFSSWATLVILIGCSWPPAYFVANMGEQITFRGCKIFWHFHYDSSIVMA